ncbi:unnamed protein product [Closterium sp. Naga37s-1]|nr:unnamed protein product [Closterium sp. Naga37s-1]
MADGQLPVGDETLDELGEEFLGDLPDGALPDLHEDVALFTPVGAQPPPSGEPAAKKLCSEGQSSAASTSGTATASLSAPPPIPRASSSGSSDATASAPGRTNAPSAPRPVPASRSRPVQPEPEPDHAAAGAATGLAPHARYRNLRRHRTTVGAILHALTRNTQAMVDVIFPESSAEEIRAAVLTRISALINGQAFNGVIPSFESAAGRLIGQQPAPAAFKKDPGLLLIGIDLDVEVWTCSLCDFECGLALDSAMYHLASETHRKHLQDSAHLPAVKEKYGAWRVTTLLQHPRITAFLQ